MTRHMRNKRNKIYNIVIAFAMRICLWSVWAAGKTVNNSLAALSISYLYLLVYIRVTWSIAVNLFHVHELSDFRYKFEALYRMVGKSVSCHRLYENLYFLKNFNLNILNLLRLAAFRNFFTPSIMSTSSNSELGQFSLGISILQLSLKTFTNVFCSLTEILSALILKHSNPIKEPINKIFNCHEQLFLLWQAVKGWAKRCVRQSKLLELSQLFIYWNSIM